jgi:hypothetical protein
MYMFHLLREQAVRMDQHHLQQTLRLRQAIEKLEKTFS